MLINSPGKSRVCELLPVIALKLRGVRELFFIDAAHDALFVRSQRKSVRWHGVKLVSRAKDATSSEDHECYAARRHINAEVAHIANVLVCCILNVHADQFAGLVDIVKGALPVHRLPEVLMGLLDELRIAQLRFMIFG